MRAPMPAPVEYGYLKPAVGPGSAEIEPTAIVFGKPDARFKLIMAAGLLGKRLVLLRTVQNEPDAPASAAYEGLGFVVQNTSGSNRIRHIAYQTALDLWRLDQQRIQLLRGFGINNQRVDELHGNAGCPVNAKTPSNPDGTINYACPTESIAEPTGGSLALAATALNRPAIRHLLPRSAPRFRFGIARLSRCRSDLARRAERHHLLSGALAALRVFRGANAVRFPRCAQANRGNIAGVFGGVRGDSLRSPGV
jgi:hypothetical protein